MHFCQFQQENFNMENFNEKVSEFQIEISFSTWKFQFHMKVLNLKYKIYILNEILTIS